jgi:hypothetical protein
MHKYWFFCIYTDVNLKYANIKYIGMQLEKQHNVNCWIGIVKLRDRTTIEYAKSIIAENIDFYCVPINEKKKESARNFCLDKSRRKYMNMEIGHIKVKE